MSISAHLNSVQLKEIIEHERKTNKATSEVQKHMEDGEGVLDPDNSISNLNTDLNIIDNKFDHECLDEVITLLNARPICQSNADWVPGSKYPTAG